MHVHGFNIYPPLPNTPANQARYMHFLNDLLQLAEYNHVRDQHTITPKMHVVSEFNGTFFQFKIDDTVATSNHLIACELLRLPPGGMCEYFLRFQLRYTHQGDPQGIEALVTAVHKIAGKWLGWVRVGVMDTVENGLWGANLAEVEEEWTWEIQKVLE